MADPLEVYQQNLAALIDAREKAGGRITPFEEHARMAELDNLYMRLGPDQRQMVVQIWGMESPHKPSLKPKGAAFDPTAVPPPVAPQSGPMNASFIPSIPASPTNAMPAYVAQPGVQQPGFAAPAAPATMSPGALGPIPPPIPMPGLAPMSPVAAAPAPAAPVLPAAPRAPRYLSDQLEDFRRVHQPSTMGHFLQCSELQMIYQRDPKNPTEQQMAMLCDDLDLPMVLTVVVDVRDVRFWRPFLPSEATGPFTELVFAGGQTLYLVGAVDYFAMMIPRVQRGDNLASEIIARQEHLISHLAERLAELVPSAAQELRDMLREHTDTVAKALLGEYPKAPDTEPPPGPVPAAATDTLSPETPRTDAPNKGKKHTGTQT